MTTNTKTLQGTADGITVTNTAGVITLNLPQDIHSGATPTFAGLTLTSPLPITSGGTNSSGPLVGQSIMVSDGTSIVQGASRNDLYVIARQRQRNSFLQPGGECRYCKWHHRPLTQKSYPAYCLFANGGTNSSTALTNNQTDGVDWWENCGSRCLDRWANCSG